MLTYFFCLTGMVHDVSAFWKLVKEIKKEGFRVETRKGKVRVFHKTCSLGVRICHPDQKGFHELRRFVAK